MKVLDSRPTLQVGFLYRMQDSKNTWLPTVVILVLVLLGGYFFSTNIHQSQKGDIGLAAVSHKEQIKKVKASITINPGGGSKVLSIQNVEIEEGKVALDLTKQVAKVETKGEGQNAFVTAINGRVADSAKNEYWEFLVNGKSAQIGAGSYKIKSGDKIEWRISTY